MRKNLFQILGMLLRVALLGHLATLSTSDPTAWREEAIQRVSLLEKKFVSLADAMPAERYTWRPSLGGAFSKRGLPARSGSELWDAAHAGYSATGRFADERLRDLNDHQVGSR